MIVPMYHPAAALHQPSLREVIKQDFLKLPELYRKAQGQRRNNPDLSITEPEELSEASVEEHDPEQLSLF